MEPEKNNLYFKQYIKYKNKYINLKNQIGGLGFEKIAKNVTDFLGGRMKNSNGEPINWTSKKINRMLNMQLANNGTLSGFEYFINSEEAGELKKKLIKALELNNIPLDEFQIKFTLDDKIMCSVEEFRLAPNPFKLCLNARDPKFLGECSVPSIEDAHKTNAFLSESVSSKLIELLDLIKEKFQSNYKQVTLGIHVGGTSFCGLSQITKSKYNFNIYFDPWHSLYSPELIGEITKQIEFIRSIDLDSSEPVTHEIRIRAGFPLHTNSEPDNNFIKSIIAISEHIYVNFINAMCLSEFQTFYKLKNFSNPDNFSFVSCPAQNLPPFSIETGLEEILPRILSKYN